MEEVVHFPLGKVLKEVASGNFSSLPQTPAPITADILHSVHEGMRDTRGTWKLVALMDAAFAGHVTDLLQKQPDFLSEDELRQFINFTSSFSKIVRYPMLAGYVKFHTTTALSRAIESTQYSTLDSLGHVYNEINQKYKDVLPISLEEVTHAMIKRFYKGVFLAAGPFLESFFTLCFHFLQKRGTFTFKQLVTTLKNSKTALMLATSMDTSYMVEVVRGLSPEVYEATEVMNEEGEFAGLKIRLQQDKRVEAERRYREVRESNTSDAVLHRFPSPEPSGCFANAGGLTEAIIDRYIRIMEGLVDTVDNIGKSDK